MTPFPAASPEALTTTGAPKRRAAALAPATVVWISARAVGIAVVEHELLGERLRRLDLSGGAGGAEDRQARRAEAIDDARLERRFGTDDGEVDVAVASEALEAVDVAHVDRDALAELGDAGVAWRGDELEVGLFPGELPGERVLATTAADEEDSHGGNIGAVAT